MSKRKTSARSCLLCEKIDPCVTAYHRFPVIPRLRELWMNACQLDTKIDDVSHTFLCSQHFKPTDYIELNARKLGGHLRLKPGVVPSVLLPGNKRKFKNKSSNIQVATYASSIMSGSETTAEVSLGACRSASVTTYDSDPLEITAADGLSLFGESANNIEFVIDTDDGSEKYTDGTKENPFVIQVSELGETGGQLSVTKDLSKLLVIGSKHNDVIDLDAPCSVSDIKSEIKIEEDEVTFIEDDEVELIANSEQDAITQNVVNAESISGKKSNTCCYVPHCTVDVEGEDTVHLFNAPTSNNLRKLWDICIDHPNKRLTAKDVVCALHFSKEDIIYEISTHTGSVLKTTLNEGAIPCLKFHEECCVPQCGNKTGPMFIFPVLQTANFDLWRYMIKNPNLKNLPVKEVLRHRVCAQHFELDCFENDYTLKPTSAPTLYLPERIITSYVPDLTSQHVQSGLSCAYGTCTNTSGTRKKVFEFPQDPDKCIAWLKACNKENLISTPEETVKRMSSVQLGVCQDHFLPHYFETFDTLKSDAIPKPFVSLTTESVRTSKSFSASDRTSNINSKGKLPKIVPKVSGKARPSAFTGVCTYRDCYNNKASEENPFFSFPVDPKRSEQWLKACGVMMTSPSSINKILKDQRICSKHFDQSMFESKNKLKCNAVPIFYTRQGVQNVDEATNNITITNYESKNTAKTIYCAVATCPNHCDLTYGKGKFPSPTEDHDRYNIWVLLVANAALHHLSPEEVCKKYMVCLRHFEPFFYMKDGKEGNLSDEAVPTKHLPGDIQWLFTTEYYKNRLQKYLQAINCDTLEKKIKKQKSEKSSLDDASTTCVLEEEGIRFINTEYFLHVDKKPNSKRKLPYEVYKFAKAGYEVCEDVTIGENIKIHTAIIIDDDDECEKQVLEALLNKKRRLVN